MPTVSHYGIKLNPKQERFCQEYLLDLNGTQAAIRTGYSRKTAYAIAERLLRKVEIQQYLQILRAELAEGLSVTQDRIYLELAKIAFANITDVLEVNADGVTLKASEAASAIAMITTTPNCYGVKISVKLASKIKALSELCDRLGYGLTLADHIEKVKQAGFTVIDPSVSCS